MEYLIITGADRHRFAKKMLSVSGKNNIKIRKAIIVEYKKSSRLSYDQLREVFSAGCMRIKIRKAKIGRENILKRW